MAKSLPQFLLAAPGSGSGKTTLCRALMAALTRRGLTVQPYKCGPDYIDTKFHAVVCHRPSVNLDTFMATPVHVRRLYHHYAATADVCIVEGMMGLFDGYDRHFGSSSEIAEQLQLPVVLVVNARSAAYSMAALLSGFARFRPDTHVVGVIFNQVGSPHHYQLLKEACADQHLSCFGYLPRIDFLQQPERYLGLDFSGAQLQAATDEWISLVENHIDLSRLLETTTRNLPPAESPWKEHLAVANHHTVVLHDEEAFSFLYTEHLDLLHQYGNVTFFDPKDNQPLPTDTQLLYLPGGYPERHATALSAATVTRASIHHYIEEGGAALAECGGMIYLSEGIDFDAPPLHVPLCGVLPFRITNQEKHRKLSLGYRQFDYLGQTLRGHEFHYTQFTASSTCFLPSSVAPVYNACGKAVSTPVFRYKNLLASYAHLYWGETNDLLKLLR